MVETASGQSRWSLFSNSFPRFTQCPTIDGCGIKRPKQNGLQPNFIVGYYPFLDYAIPTVGAFEVFFLTTAAIW
ncbi:MAG: hypothetical protein HYV28_10060 [Ignavibacteriales bacterium]|nr:hypothetical protein [Ignavibacteriales bacterium]